MKTKLKVMSYFWISLCSVLLAGQSDLDPTFDGTDNRADDGILNLALAYTGIHMTKIDDLLVLENDAVLFGGGYYLLKVDEFGDVDTSYGTNGHLNLTFEVCDLLSLSNGNVLAVGADATGLAAAEVDPSGSLVSSFGTNGYIHWNTLAVTYDVTAAETATGKILLASRSLVQFNRDGTLDTSFGTGGSIVAIPAPVVQILPGTGGLFPYAYGLTAKDSNKLAIMAIHSDGSPFLAFGSNGLAETGEIMVTGQYLIPTDLVRDGDGGFLALGYRNTQLNLKINKSYVARFDGSGTLMTNEFNVGGTYPGVQFISYGTVNGYARDAFHALAVGADRKIVVAGQAGQHKMTIVRLNADGTFDETFGGVNSWDKPGLVYDVIRSGNAGAYAVGIDSQGRIIAAGGDIDYPQNRYAMRMLGDSWVQPSAGDVEFYLHPDGEFRIGVTLSALGAYQMNWSTNLIDWIPFGSTMNGTGTYYEVSMPPVFEQMYFQVREVN